MKKSEEKLETWVRDWIEEQRRKLQKSADSTASAEGEPKPQGAGGENLWLQFAQGLWGGFERLTAAAFKDLGPPLGWAREQEQGWRDLATAQANYRKLETLLLALLSRVHQDAFSLLDQKVRARASADEAIKDVRELYDLWIECGETVYSQCVRSEAYCRAQAEFANAAFELRAKQQAILERGLKCFDLPTRNELNSVHLQLRELRSRMDEHLPMRKPAAKQRAAKRASAKGRGKAKSKARRRSS